VPFKEKFPEMLSNYDNILTEIPSGSNHSNIDQMREWVDRLSSSKRTARRNRFTQRCITQHLPDMVDQHRQSIHPNVTSCLSGHEESAFDDDFHDQVNKSTPLDVAVRQMSPAHALNAIVVHQYGGSRGFEEKMGMPFLHYLIIELRISPEYAEFLLEDKSSPYGCLSPKRTDVNGQSALIYLWKIFTQQFHLDLSDATDFDCRYLFKYTFLLQKHISTMERKRLDKYILNSWTKFYSVNND